MKILIMLICLFLVGCSTPRRQYAESILAEKINEVGKKQEVIQTVERIKTEHELCDVVIFDEVILKNYMSIKNQEYTYCRFSYIGNDNVIYTQTEFLKNVNIQKSSDGKNKLIKYSDHNTIYLCLTEELYRELYE